MGCLFQPSALFRRLDPLPPPGDRQARPLARTRTRASPAPRATTSTSPTSPSTSARRTSTPSSPPSAPPGAHGAGGGVPGVGFLRGFEAKKDPAPSLSNSGENDMDSLSMTLPHPPPPPDTRQMPRLPCSSLSAPQNTTCNAPIAMICSFAPHHSRKWCRHPVAWGGQATGPVPIVDLVVLKHLATGVVPAARPLTRSRTGLRTNSQI